MSGVDPLAPGLVGFYLSKPAVRVDQPEDAAAEIAAGTPGLMVEQVLDTPFALFARDADDAAQELRRRQRVYGFDSVTTHQPNLEVLGEVMAAYRSQAEP